VVVSLQQFVENLARSGLMSAGEVSAFLRGRPAEKQPEDAQTLAQALVQAGKLTKYQALMLYQGRPKGLVFGEYTVLDKLGQGGMGVVLKAQHRRMKRFVAVKVLPAAAMKSAGAVKRFYREVEAAAKLNHPNIVQAYDAGEHEGLHYLVMEYVEGRDLASVVKEQGPLEVRQALDCILQAAKGLAYAHGEGVVHRDIKPGNLLLDKKGTVKILDMGLARVALAVGGDAQSDERLTQSGQVMGTCDYMAPEQAEDTRKADQRSDVYSLGCTLYRLLTGKVPYGGDSLMQVLLAHRDAPIPSLETARPEVPAGVAAIFEKMVAKRPEDRYPSVLEVIADIEAFLGDERCPPLPVPAPGPADDFLLQSPALLRVWPSDGVTQRPEATVGKAGVAGAATYEDTLRPWMHDGTGRALVNRMHRAASTARRKPRASMAALAGAGALLAIVLGLILSSRHPANEPSFAESRAADKTPATAAAEGTAEELPGFTWISASEGKGTRIGGLAQSALPIGPWAPSPTSRDDFPKPIHAASYADFDRLATGPWIDVLNSPQAVARAHVIRTSQGPRDSEAEPGALWVNGEVQVTERVALLDHPVKDCLIRAKVRKVSGHSVGFVLHYDAQNMHHAHFSCTVPEAGWGGIGRTVSEAHQSLWKTPSGTAVPRPEEGYLEIAFSAIGDTLKSYVNGKAFGEARDETHRAGLPCIYAFNREKQAKAFFKDIQIQVLDQDR